MSTHDEAMKEAGRQARLKMACTGREDCTATHHLACCHNKRKKETK